MTEKQNTVPCFTMVKEQIAPVRIPDSFRIENAQEMPIIANGAVGSKFSAL